MRHLFSSCFLSILACHAWKQPTAMADWNTGEVLVIVLMCFLCLSHKQCQCYNTVRIESPA